MVANKINLTDTQIADAINSVDYQRSGDYKITENLELYTQKTANHKMVLIGTVSSLDRAERIAQAVLSGAE